MKLDAKIRELEKRVKELEERKPETHLHFYPVPYYVVPLWPQPIVPWHQTWTYPGTAGGSHAVGGTQWTLTS